MVYKYTAAAALALLFATSAFSQTVMTYGNNKVSKDEFWRAYSKNKSENLKDEKAIMDYADLYSKFKLKVQAAQDMRLDTLPHIKDDVLNFRSQIMESYLADEKAVKKLEKEAFDRSQKDLHVIHYSVSFGLLDSANAKKKINEAYDLLSSNKSASTIEGLKTNDFGFITAFSVPYNYENIIYGTKPGSYSKPYMSGNAWHIFKVEGTRPASGTWKVAQILFSLPPDATPAEKADVKHRADSVYNLLKQGYSFSEAAANNSNDRITNLAEGLLPEFGTGKYGSDFEDKVFALQTDGEISKPFLTSFGYHIVKRIRVKPVPATDKDAEYMYEIKTRVAADSRMAIEKENYENEIVTITGFKVAPGITTEGIINLWKDSLNTKTQKIKDDFPVAGYKVGPDVTMKDWRDYANEYTRTHENDGSMTDKDLWQKFVKYRSLQQYKDNLETYSPDFKYQLKEFNDGNMLFEAMDKKVWGKAASEETALHKYYDEHKSKYTWEKSAAAIIFNCTSRKAAEDAMAASKKGMDWRTIMMENEGNVIVDSGRYDLDQLIDRKSAPNPTPGTYSTIVENSDNVTAFILYKQIYPAGDTRSFEDARGLVINDYQDVLEKQWIDELMKKYPVTINTAALRELSK